MAWTEKHRRGYRGVYRAPDGTKPKTQTFRSKKKAIEAARDEEAKVGTCFTSRPPDWTTRGHNRASIASGSDHLPVNYPG